MVAQRPEVAVPGAVAVCSPPLVCRSGEFCGELSKNGFIRAGPIIAANSCGDSDLKPAFRSISVCLAALTLVALWQVPSTYAESVTIGAPGDPDTGNCIPFGCNGFTSQTEYVYQQVYSSDLFSTPLAINTISFFNFNYVPGTVDEATYSVYLSTTDKLVNGLDTSNLDNNVGADNTLIFSGTLGGAGSITGGVFTITGSTFLYDPSLGNLLLEVLKTGGTCTGGDLTDPGCAYNGLVYLDSHFGTFGTESSRASNFCTAGPPTCNDLPSTGLVTEFSAVPEPATLSLVGVGLAGFLARRCKRKRGQSSL